VVVLMAGLVATEGADQPDANMLHDQNRMLDELLEINPMTVVVMKDSNPVLMPWIDKARAVLEVWNQGSEDGHVVADLLFGVVNPSGKVPTSYPRSEADTLYAGKPERYPGVDEGAGYPVMRYSEGLEIGYRWFQAQGIEPLFGFGFGLSYTTFELDGVAVTWADPDKLGGFYTDWALPRTTPAGWHTLAADCGDGTTLAPVRFLSNGAAPLTSTVEPRTVRAGEALTISGSGCGGSQTVEMTFEGVPGGDNLAESGGDGSFSLWWGVPADAKAGDYTLRIRCVATNEYFGDTVLTVR
jgi:hypothetical protein